MEKRYKLKSKNDLDSIPKNKIISKKTITQTYANFNPDVRVRKIDQEGKQSQYFHTTKYFLKNNQREELEYPISEEQYNRIFDWIGKKPVIKDRYLVDLDNGLLAEVDDFADSDEVIVEVEFKNEDDMKSFLKPNWFGSEIKDKKSFSEEMFARINNKGKDIYDIIREQYK